MHVFLVVVAYWSMAYRGDQVTPAMVQEMPSFAACWEAGKAVKAMSHADFRCIKAK